MTAYETQVAEFHAAFGVDADVPFSESALALRKALIAEEVRELFAELDKAADELRAGKSVSTATAAALLKELADVQYVVSGTAVTFGLPLEEAVTRVHDSNMSKLGADGKPVRREDGKVLKGPDYRPAVLDDLVTDAA